MVLTRILRTLTNLGLYGVCLLMLVVGLTDSNTWSGGLLEEAINVGALALMAIFLVLPTWMTLKYDRQFKKALIAVANADPWMQIYPVPINFIMNLRYCRGSAYAGAVLTYKCPRFLKARVAYQKYLVDNPNFTSRINWVDSLLVFSLAIFFFYLFVLLLIQHLNKWFGL